MSGLLLWPTGLPMMPYSLVPGPCRLQQPRTRQRGEHSQSGDSPTRTPMLLDTCSPACCRYTPHGHSF